MSFETDSKFQKPKSSGELELPRAVSLAARTILEKVWSAPSARSQHGFPALFKAVEAAIVRRRIVKGTPRAGRLGLRCAASDQEQEREAGDQSSHCFVSLRGAEGCSLVRMPTHLGVARSGDRAVVSASVFAGGG
jgi:hypothetical protein